MSSVFILTSFWRFSFKESANVSPLLQFCLLTFLLLVQWAELPAQYIFMLYLLNRHLFPSLHIGDEAWLSHLWKHLRRFTGIHMQSLCDYLVRKITVDLHGSTLIKVPWNRLWSSNGLSIVRTSFQLVQWGKWLPIDNNYCLRFVDYFCIAPKARNCGITPGNKRCDAVSHQTHVLRQPTFVFSSLFSVITVDLWLELG